MKRNHLSSNSFVKERVDYETFVRSNNEGKNCSRHVVGDDIIAWPPKNYACSFCKREFKSAQALGGHMNVHRRDRARLRQLPSWLFQCPYHPKTNPNSTPIFSSPLQLSSPLAPLPPPPPPPKASPFSGNLSSPPLPESSLKGTRAVNGTRAECYLTSPKKGGLANDFPEVGQPKTSTTNSKAFDTQGSTQEDQLIGLDLEMGFKDPRQVLDLELRLGYFN